MMTATFRACAGFVLVLIAPVLSASAALPQAPATGGGNLLANAGAEEGESDPQAWQRGMTVPGVEFAWDRGTGHKGGSSLRLRKTVERYIPPTEWYQEMRHDGGARGLRVRAHVKADALTKAVIDVQFLGPGDAWSHQWAAYIGAEGPQDPPVTHDWRAYSGEVSIPEGTQRVRVALQIYGPGTIWFDDVEATWTAASAQAGKSGAAGTTPVSSDKAATFEDLRAEGRSEQRYLLHRGGGPAVPPKDGYRLLLVLPGGDGGADFAPFVGDLARQALPEGYLVAQLVAPQGTAPQKESVVWPTKGLARQGMTFTTEGFIEAVVRDVKKRVPIDARYVFALGWSSGGPPVYAAALRAQTPLTGAFVAMSVFKPAQMPDLHVKDRAVYVMHSPTDFIPMRFAEEAVRTVSSGGGQAEFIQYEGGHGWHGDVFGRIRTGIRWLEDRMSVKSGDADDRDR
ncbi:MAG: hypothetical protein FLDDKLPJ_01255 [Phycisphaerae bacterium]|nr:hypothetical protein [Phycisphaerae bacterium]